jgi:hypothetical protein
MDIINNKDIGQQNINSTVVNNYPERKLTSKQQEHLKLLEKLELYYRDRIKEKLKTELRFQLELHLKYTKEGTNKKHRDNYYIDCYEEKPTESFDILFADYVTKLKRLLILGEAGSGKTVLLLQFALKLIEVAKQDFDYPLPVFLSLATWRDEKQSFETWLKENLLEQFSFLKKDEKILVSANNYLLLLDGLDEIPKNDRKICLEKLRVYLDKVEKSQTITKNYSTTIISSRKQEYLDLHIQAPVRATIQVADLTSEKVCKELEKIKQSQDTNAQILLNRIAENPSIAKKLKSAFEVHLALNMAPTFDFAQLNTKNLVNAYLNQEINELEEEYPKARHYLIFLAKKMQENRKKIGFDWYDIQIDWIDNNQYRKIFLIRLFFSFLLILPFINIFEYLHSGLLYIILLALTTSQQDVLSALSLTKNISYAVQALKYPKWFPTIISTILVLSETGNSFFLILFFYIMSLTLSNLFSTKTNSKTRVTQFSMFIISIFFYMQYFLIYFFVEAHTPLFKQINSLACILNISMLSFTHIFRVICISIICFFDSKIPFFLSFFLNKVSQTGILEKDGGQWRFRHQLLQDALGK